MRKIIPQIITVFLVISSVSFLVIYRTQINDSFHDTSASNYLLVGVIAMEGGSFLIGQLLDTKKRKEEKLENHTLELNEIYKRLCRIGLTTRGSSGNQMQFSVPRSHYMNAELANTSNINRLTQSMPTAPNHNYLAIIPFDQMNLHPDYQDFDFAIDHLKYDKYENINEHWIEANRLLNQYNALSGNPTKEEMEKINNELKLFAKELKTLVTQLKARKIEGKCPKCSS